MEKYKLLERLCHCCGTSVKTTAAGIKEHFKACYWAWLVEKGYRKEVK